MEESIFEKDQYLWQALKKGKKEALSQLFNDYAESLYNYGYLICRNREVTEDCLQDLFLQLWKNHRQLKDVANIKTYLLVALRNRISSNYRSTKEVSFTFVGENEIGEEISSENHWIENENQLIRAQFVKKAVSSLPNRMKQALHLRYYESLDYTDIAEIMNIKRQVAVNMVHRATLKLRVFSKQYAEWLYSFLLFFFLFA